MKAKPNTSRSVPRSVSQCDQQKRHHHRGFSAHVFVSCRGLGCTPLMNREQNKIKINFLTCSNYHMAWSICILPIPISNQLPKNLLHKLDKSAHTVLIFYDWVCFFRFGVGQ